MNVLKEFEFAKLYALKLENLSSHETFRPRQFK